MLVTALVTPFVDAGERVDLDMLQRLVAFQLEHGADQVLLSGTTGEASVLDEEERAGVLDAALGVARPEQIMLSIGGGRLDECLARGRGALESGVRDLLLADCPYSGASSSALRTEWHGPAAAALPAARFYPYAVPGRTGTEMLPDDLARLHEDHPNVVGVKDATGRLARMRRVRELCGDDFVLLCGEDHMLRDALVEPSVRAQGGCSVIANLVPERTALLIDLGVAGDAASARRVNEELHRLAGLVSVTCDETVVVGGQSLSVPNRYRNPLPLKAALAELGVLREGCRAPLGTMGPNGQSRVRTILRLTLRRHPDILSPLGVAFGVDPGARLELDDVLLRSTT